ncbi:MAG: hypothetical protein E7124_04450 [Bacteroidales bacterium]|nr:hypothetical protein [Bacteroidales bacterium]
MKKIALMMLLAIAAVACQNEPEIVPEVNVTSTSTTLPVAGTEDLSFKVTFKTNVDWTAALKEQVQWCTVTPAKGVAGDAAVTVIAEENETKEPREVTLVITAGTAKQEVKLTQLQVDAFELVKESDTVGAEGGTYDLKVMTNVEYSVVIPEDVDWVTVSKAYAEATTKLVVAPFETLDATRTAELTVKAAGLEDLTFTLVQEGPSSQVWAVDMSTVMNYTSTCTTFDGTADMPNNVSIALFDGNLVVCAGDGSSPVVLDKTTGEKKSTITAWDPHTYYIKNDDAGNLVLGNRIWGWNYYCLRYIAPGTSTPVPITDYWNAYVGANFSVRGDVTKSAIIGAPKENGDYGSNTIFTVHIGLNADATVSTTYSDMQVTSGFGGIDWLGGGYWFKAPSNIPALAFLGNTRETGALLSVYGENKLYLLNTATDEVSATLLSEAQLLDSNTAANAMDARLIGGTTYVAVTGGNMYATPSAIQVINTATNQVYTLKTSGFAPEFETNMSAAVVIEEAEGGIDIYYVNNSTKAIGKHFLPLE